MRNSLVKSDFTLRNPITRITVKDPTVSYTAEGRVDLLSSEDYLVKFSFRRGKKYSEQ